LSENAKAVEIELSGDEEAEFRAAVDGVPKLGARYPEAMMRLCFGDTPAL
jgi:hypothetical protein